MNKIQKYETVLLFSIKNKQHESQCVSPVTLCLLAIFTSAQGQTMKQTQYFLSTGGDCTSSNFLYDVTHVKSTCSSTVETTCATLEIYPTYKTLNKCTTVLPNEENSKGHVIISAFDSITCNASDISTITRIKLGVCYYNGYFSIRYESCSKITTFTMLAQWDQLPFLPLLILALARK